MMNHSIADLLDSLDFFSEFAYAELETLARHLTSVTAKKGEVIFSEGDPGSHMLILVDGRMSISKGGENGQHLLSYEGRGRIIGEMALLDRERRSATCTAEADCRLLTLDHDSLNRLATAHAALAYRFMFAMARLLSRRLRRTSGVLAEYLS